MRSQLKLVFCSPVFLKASLVGVVGLLVAGCRPDPTDESGHESEPDSQGNDEQPEDNDNGEADADGESNGTADFGGATDTDMTPEEILEEACAAMCQNFLRCDHGVTNLSECVAECIGTTDLEGPNCLELTTTTAYCVAGLTCEELVVMTTAQVNGVTPYPCSEEFEASGDCNFDD